MTFARSKTTDITDFTDKYDLEFARNPICIERARAVTEELVHRELSETIIGAAMTVLNQLKPGLDEKLYERALVIELVKRGHTVDQQKRFPVFYDGRQIGTLIPDLIVDDLVLADAKVVSAFHDEHVAKMIGYLSITDLRLAILLNFKHARLGWKRIVR